MGVPQTPVCLPVPIGPTPHRWGPHLWLAVLAVLVSVRPAASAEQMLIPPIAAVEQGAYRVRDSHTGQELWEGAWLLQRENGAGHFSLQLQEEGSGLRDSALPTVWTERVTLDLWGLRPSLTAIRVTRDAAGLPVSVDQREFDYELGTGQVVRRDATTGDAEVRSVSLTGQAISTEMLPGILRLLPGAPAQQLHFDLVTDVGRLVGMRATVVGREWVTVPAGTFECFKVELNPTGVAGLLLAAMRVNLYMWVTIAAPHFWVKYEGPSGGVDSRQIVKELIRFDAWEASATEPRRALASPPPDIVIASLRAPGSPYGGHTSMLASLWYVFLLVAIVFEIGVEAAVLSSD